MITYSLFGTKGGVGTSTAAAMMAIGLSKSGHKVVLRSPDAKILIGEQVAGNNVRYMENGLVVTRFHGLRFHESDAPDYEIVDCQNLDGFRDDPADERIAVIDGTYASLVKGSEAFRLSDRVLWVSRGGLALTRSDIASAVRQEVIETPYEARIARASDAGLLLSRNPSTIMADMAEGVTCVV